MSSGRGSAASLTFLAQLQQHMLAEFCQNNTFANSGLQAQHFLKESKHWTDCRRRLRRRSLYMLFTNDRIAGKWQDTNLMCFSKLWVTAVFIWAWQTVFKFIWLLSVYVRTSVDILTELSASEWVCGRYFLQKLICWSVEWIVSGWMLHSWLWQHHCAAVLEVDLCFSGDESDAASSTSPASDCTLLFDSWDVTALSMLCNKHK